MTMITPSYLGETIEYSSLHACRSTLEDPTTGNGRRIITIPVVDTLSPTAMTVLGFRQFLLQPNSGATDITTGDTYGRFLGMYIGSVAPVPQGRFDGCTMPVGPGKVVLHQ